MTNLLDRIDVLAEIDACERIWAFDETRLDVELCRTGLNPEGLLRRLQPALGLEVEAAGSGSAVEHAAAASQSPSTVAQEPAGFELAGTMKFFDATRGFGFFVADDGQGDVLVHVSCLRLAGYQTAYSGARIHALVHRTPKGLQVLRIVSMDERSAVHPSELPQRTREKVQADSDWVRATVKWYSREDGYGFVFEREGSPDCFIHADVLRRWGVAPLWPKQVVEIRWGMGSKGRMVAEIRYIGGTPGLPPTH